VSLNEHDGGFDDRPARIAWRRVVVATLRDHELIGHVAAVIWTAARRLVRDTARRGVEHAMTFDADSGQTIGSTISGPVWGASIEPHLRLLRPGREYVTIHTHPGSTSFSDIDVYLTTS